MVKAPSAAVQEATNTVVDHHQRRVDRGPSRIQKYFSRWCSFKHSTRNKQSQFQLNKVINNNRDNKDALSVVPAFQALIDEASIVL